MSKKNKTHDSVMDIFYYEMFSLFVGLLIVIGCDKRKLRLGRGRKNIIPNNK